MAWVELIAKRNQKEKHYFDADTNKYQAVFTIHDQHYKDDFDDWIDVDENFEDDTGGFNKKCDKTRHAIHIANGGARRWYPRRNVSTEYVDITNMQYWTGSQWRNLNLPTPVWTNNKTEWDMTNLYASITNTWKRIKTDFTLKNSNAYTRLRFAVSFTGLTYNDTTGELTSTTDGLVWGSIDKPTAYYGDAENPTNVPVTQTYDGTYIEWSVDTTGATFPIYVDPTFTDGYGGDVQTYYDCWTWENNADTATNTNTDMFVSNNSGGAARRMGLFNFNLDSIPDDATIDSAYLQLITTAATDSISGDIYVNAILSANNGWSESCTWNYADGAGASDRWAGDTGNDGGSDAGCSVSGTDWNGTAACTFDIPTYASGVMVNGPNGLSLSTTQFASWLTAFYGIVLRGSDSFISLQVGSSDNATTGSRPKLVVEYTEGGCVNVVNVTDVITVTEPIVVVDWCEP